MAIYEIRSQQSTLNGLKRQTLGLKGECVLANGDSLDAGEGLKLSVLHPLGNEEHVVRLGVENVTEAVHHVKLNDSICSHFNARGGNRSRHSGILVEKVEE